MSTQDLEREIKEKLVSTVNKSTMINVIKQRFIASTRPSAELSKEDIVDLNGFSGDISKYKKDKIGLYGGVKHGS